MKYLIEKELHQHEVEVRVTSGLTVAGQLILAEGNTDCLLVRRAGEQGAYYINTAHIEFVKDKGKLEESVNVE